MINSRRRPRRHGRGAGLADRRPRALYTVLFGVVCILLETFMSYARYAAVLKWATLSLFAYVAVVFAAHVPWGTALYKHPRSASRV